MGSMNSSFKGHFQKHIQASSKTFVFFLNEPSTFIFAIFITKNAVPYIIHDVYVCKITDIGLTENYDFPTPTQRVGVNSTKTIVSWM